jgi:hypothetical protein
MAHKRIGALVAFVLLARTATAQADFEPSRWSLTPLFGTHVGTDVGGGIEIEAPCRLRLMVTFGWMPEAYAWVIKRVYTDIHNGREAVGNLLQDTLEGSHVATGSLSFRPFARHGLFFGGAYAYLHTSKDALFAGELESAVRMALPETRATFSRTFNSDITAHAVAGSIGWQWGIGRGFTLRASLGVAWIFNVDADYEPNFTPSNPEQLRVFKAAVENRIETAGEDVVTPTGSLYLGYTFQ